MYDVLVLGSGVAGLTTALHAARRGLSVLVLTKGELSHSATRYAQGGVAAALAAPDTPDLHLVDTLTAGAGLCDADAVRILVTEGPDRVRELARARRALRHRAVARGPRAAARPRGRPFARARRARGRRRDRRRDRAGARRGGQHQRRDRGPRGLVRDRAARRARPLRGRARARPPTAQVEFVRATDVVLATGGAGQCFAVTTNPTLSTGDGIALALKAGVACADLEFVQFHPTALHTPLMPRPLHLGGAAGRGRGAARRRRRRVHGRPAPARRPRAPRRRRPRGATNACRRPAQDHVWLDATMIDDFQRHFPTIWFSCLRAEPRPDRGVAAGRAGRALPLGRRRHRSRRRDHARPSLGVRRGRVQRRARREPARLELAARRARLRAPGRRGDPRGQGDGGIDRRDDAACSICPSGAPEADPVVLPKERVTEPDAVRGACSARCRPTAASCATPTASRSRARRSATSPASPTISPRARIASYEVIDLLRVVARDRRRRDGAHRVAGRAHAPRVPGPVRRAARPVRVRGGAAPVVRRPARRRRPRPVMTTLRSAPRDRPPARRRRARRGPRHPRRHHVDRVHRRGRSRPKPRSSPGPTACWPGTALATETFRQLDDVDRRRVARRTTATRSRAGARARSGVRARCARSSPASGRANFLCHCSRHRHDDAPVRAWPCTARMRVLDTRKTLPGLRAIAARRGARRRRLQPPRLAERRGADQGQPRRRGRHRQVDRAGPVGVARAA